jgi:hypothetical protein
MPIFHCIEADALAVYALCPFTHGGYLATQLLFMSVFEARGRRTLVSALPICSCGPTLKFLFMRSTNASWHMDCN